MNDTIETIGKSVIQHGKLSDRVYLMKLKQDDYPHILESLDILAARHHYSKIFVKVPDWAAPAFSDEGYLREAVVPGFYSGRDDALFMARFTDPARAEISDRDRQRILTALDIVREKADETTGAAVEETLVPRRMTEADAQALSDLYASVFKTYPFPIFNDDYIRDTMDSHCVYFGIYDGDRLVAASSSEMDTRHQNAEMTDFATLPDYQGNNLSAILLRTMETHMASEGMKTLYTIARSCSVGMNITFARLGYRFSGMLVNNTNISGRIESMNVWYKPIDSDGL